MDDLISAEQVTADGGQCSPVATIFNFGPKFWLPRSVLDSNVLKFSVHEAMECKACSALGENMVIRGGLSLGQRLVVTRCLAPLLGFYNPFQGMLSPAYGKPVFDSAWFATVVGMFDPTITCGATVYSRVVMWPVEPYQRTAEEL